VTILKGIGLPVTSIGDVEGTADTEELAWESSEDEIRYWKLVLRDERLDGAVLMGRWPETQSVLDAVASHAEVAGVLETLRAGDLTALTAG
jgi:NAD(P)H-nitrite reductase large subunit